MAYKIMGVVHESVILYHASVGVSIRCNTSGFLIWKSFKTILALSGLHLRPPYLQTQVAWHAGVHVPAGVS